MTDYNKINPCNACTLRHGEENLHALNDCCYKTCSQFISGSVDDIVNSECGQNCRNCIESAQFRVRGKGPCALKMKVPLIEPYKQSFKKCMAMTKDDTKEALGCCLNECGTDTGCQETCIDNFNALIYVKENYILGYRINKSLFFLFAITLLHILISLNYLKMPLDTNKNILTVIVIHLLLYYVVYYMF
jgi:hypothetical protein